MGIILSNVSFKYDKDLFNNLNLEINYNTITGIIGKSGSGKTTFLELIANILKPSEGKIIFEDFYKSIKNIGIIFQMPEKEFFNVYVDKEISFALNNFNMNKKRLVEVIKLVGLKEDILNKKIKELSNGEKRLIAIASTLVYNPKLILFDEPTIGLDYKNKKKVINLIKNLKNRYEKTIIIVSHDIDLMYELCDDLIVLSNGKLILYGNTLDVFNEIDLIKKYDIPIPKVVLFENLVKEKNIKLLKSRNVNDLIKEVYRNV